MARRSMSRLGLGGHFGAIGRALIVAMFDPQKTGWSHPHCPRSAAWAAVASISTTAWASGL
jgi:hypothetical protein